MKKILAIFLLLGLLLSACAPAAEPTMNPVDVQNTAIAAAWTVVALTQAAIPTATPIPPTETPIPTLPPTSTPLPLPTLALPTQGNVNVNPVPGGPTADPCNAPVSGGAAGPRVRVKLVNKTDGAVTLSVWLTAPTEFGECGYYAFNLSKNDSPVVELLKGCYGAGAFITSGKNEGKSFGGFCLGNPAELWTVDIRPDNIGF